MDKSKNLLESWMKNWMEASKKFQQTMNQKNDFDQSVNFYNDWFNNQKKMMESLFNVNTNNSKNFENPTDFMTQMFQMQSEFGKNWMESIQKMAQSFNGNGQNKFASATQIHDSWNQIYTQWMNQFGKPFGSSGKPFEHTPMETFGQMLNTTNTYMKLFEVWQPILETLQNQKASFNNLKNAFDTKQFQELINGLFNTITPEQSKGFFDQINNFTLSLVDSLKSVNTQLVDKFDRIAHLLPNTFAEEFSGGQEIGYEMYGKLQKSIAPLFTMVPPSKEKDMVLLMMGVQDQYVKYYTKSNEIQTLISTTAGKAMEKVLKQIAQKASEKPEPIVFDDFFNIWLDITEADMIALYSSDAFSRLQGEILTIGSSIKKSLDQQMEEMIAHLPLAPRSEIDELTATIHELRSKVRKLEKDIKETKQGQTKTEKAEVEEKKTTTPVKKVKATAKQA